MQFLYIDPNAGSILLQILIATLVGFGLFWRRGVNAIRRLLGRRKTNQEQDNQDE